jgi:hypothetical protein
MDHLGLFPNGVHTCSSPDARTLRRSA